jgi:hypothetical protein
MKANTKLKIIFRVHVFTISTLTELSYFILKPLCIRHTWYDVIWEEIEGLEGVDSW